MGSRQLAVAELSNKTETHAVRSKADNFQSEHDKFLKEFDSKIFLLLFLLKILDIIKLFLEYFF